jgi:hypothetical protein
MSFNSVPAPDYEVCSISKYIFFVFLNKYIIAIALGQDIKQNARVVFSISIKSGLEFVLESVQFDTADDHVCRYDFFVLWCNPVYMYSSYSILHCTQNPIYVYPEMKLRGLVPNSYIYLSVSDLYIYSQDRSAYCLQQNRRTDPVNI